MKCFFGYLHPEKNVQGKFQLWHPENYIGINNIGGDLTNVSVEKYHWWSVTSKCPKTSLNREPISVDVQVEYLLLDLLADSQVIRLCAHQNIHTFIPTHITGHHANFHTLPEILLNVQTM